MSEDERTWQAFNATRALPMPFEMYQELRHFWRLNGGGFHGPNIETGSMPECKLLPLLMQLQDALSDVARLHKDKMDLLYPDVVPQRGPEA